MANVLPDLEPADRALALVQGLAFVSRDTRGRAPRFPLLPLHGALRPERLAAWYRRFIETRSADAAERTLVSAIVDEEPSAVADVMFTARPPTTCSSTAVTPSISRTRPWSTGSGPPGLGVGYYRAADAGGPDGVGQPQRGTGLVALSPRPGRDVRAAVGDRYRTACAAAPALRNLRRPPTAWPAGVGRSWVLRTLCQVVSAIDDAVALRAATAEELGRAVAYAAALRITRFHTQNDHGDWDEVHHAFTAANAPLPGLAILRAPSPESAAGRPAHNASARVSGPVPQRAGRPPAGRSGRRWWGRAGRAPRLLGPGGTGGRGREHRSPVPGRGRRPGPGHRRARAGPARRGRRVPLVPDLRGGRPPAPRLAGGIRGGRAHPGRHRPIPGRPHADATGVVPGGQDRHPGCRSRRACPRSRRGDSHRWPRRRCIEHHPPFSPAARNVVRDGARRLPDDRAVRLHRDGHLRTRRETVPRLHATDGGVLRRPPAPR